MAGKKLENVFHAMGETCDAGDTDNVRGSLDGMRDTLGLTDVLEARLVADDALHTAGQSIDVLRRLVQESVHELGIDVIGKTQSHIVFVGGGRRWHVARGSRVRL